MLEVSCRLVVAEFGLNTVRLVAAFSFRICDSCKISYRRNNTFGLVFYIVVSGGKCCFYHSFASLSYVCLAKNILLRLISLTKSIYIDSNVNNIQATISAF